MRFVQCVGLLFFLLFGLSLCPALHAQQRETEGVNDLLRQARALVEQEKFKDAIPLLERAVKASPDSLLAHQWLGYTYAQLGERERAVRAFARALQLEPSNEKVKQTLIQWLPDKLPARADTATLDALCKHVYGTCERKEFAVDVNVAVRPPLPNPERLAFYTHGVLFAPDDTRDPSLGKDFNRVCMGYVLDPNDNEWQLRFRVFYVSESIARQGRNYAPLAEQVCTTLLRLYWLAQQALNATTRFSPGKPTDVWLCEAGEVGAEQPANAPAHLYFYDISNPERSFLEWARQIAHEYGHLVLPGIDGFERDVEPYINGHAGERLFLLWFTAQSLAAPEPPSDVATFQVSSRELAAYVRDRSYAALRRFLDAGPRSPLIEDTGLGGMEFLVGLLLYVERTHSSLLTQAVLNDLGKQVGVFLTGRDLFNAYALTLEKRGILGYSFYPTVPAPRFSRLSQQRTAEQLAQNAPLALHEGDEAAYWVYLPSGGKGKWTLEVTADAPSPGVLSVAFDAAASSRRGETLPAGAPTKVAFTLPIPLDGWQLVRMKWQSGASPVTLKELRWHRGEVADGGHRMKQVANSH